MCVLCGEAVLKVHWTDARPGTGPTARALADDGGAARERARDRRERVAALHRVLGHHGLGVRAWGPVMYVLSDRKGSASVVRDLGGLWAEAERLLGRPLDPLDPALREALVAERGAGGRGMPAAPAGG